MACAPMKRKAILRVLHSTDCPSSAYQEVLVNVAQSLLEVQQRDAGEIAAVVTQDAALFIIGAAFDGAEIGPSVRALIDEWALYSTPKVHGTARNPGTNGTNGTTIEVVSLTDKEARDKYITLQGTKLWRNSARPLYCSCIATTGWDKPAVATRCGRPCSANSSARRPRIRFIGCAMKRSTVSLVLGLILHEPALFRRTCRLLKSSFFRAQQTFWLKVSCFEKELSFPPLQR